MWERKFFEDWMEFILPKGSKRSTADNIVSNLINADGISRAAGSATYRNEYVSTVQVIAFHDTGIPSARYTFEEAYPVMVTPQPLNWGDDGINRVNVTFKYTTWSREKNIVKQIYDAFRKNP
jgi:predicted YcjX-like family ATPase